MDRSMPFSELTQTFCLIALFMQYLWLEWIIFRTNNSIINTSLIPPKSDVKYDELNQKCHSIRPDLWLLSLIIFDADFDERNKCWFGCWRPTGSTAETLIVQVCCDYDRDSARKWHKSRHKRYNYRFAWIANKCKRKLSETRTEPNWAEQHRTAPNWAEPRPPVIANVKFRCDLWFGCDKRIGKRAQLFESESLQTFDYM